MTRVDHTNQFGEVGHVVDETNCNVNSNSNINNNENSSINTNTNKHHYHHYHHHQQQQNVPTSLMSLPVKPSSSAVIAVKFTLASTLFCAMDTFRISSRVCARWYNTTSNTGSNETLHTQRLPGTMVLNSVFNRHYLLIIATN